MLISLLLQLHLERKEKLPKCQVASLGITVHAECSFSLFQMHFKALLIKEKSIMFSPPFSRSPITLVFFSLTLLLSHMILRWSCLPDHRIFQGLEVQMYWQQVLRRLEISQYFSILRELIFVYSSFLTCFPKYNLSRVFQSILICHLCFCSLKSKRTSYIQSKHCIAEWALFACLS